MGKKQRENARLLKMMGDCGGASARGGATRPISLDTETRTQTAQPQRTVQFAPTNQIIPAPTVRPVRPIQPTPVQPVQTASPPPKQRKRVSKIADRFQSTVTTVTNPESYKAIAMPTMTRLDTIQSIVSCISGASFPSEVSSCGTYDTQAVTPTVRDRLASTLSFGDQVFYDTAAHEPKAALGHRTQKARSRSMHSKSKTIPVAPVFRRVSMPQ